ncbi:hypothetical protein ACJJIF_01030 [Microbulbifer sp. SSSA002]|uniref:hypothetical protein n=1 Tax=Microbulbifer sp. SSSA002 TaxID=3243376 RepID=UPI004039AD0D
MKTILLSWALIISTSLCFAQAPAVQSDDSIGTHGMALLAVDGQIIASHMPLHGGRHSHQVILGLEVTDRKDVNKLLQQHKLVTLLPETFSLNALRSGTLNAFSAQLFNGHFERGGKPALQTAFQVTTRLMDSPLVQKENGHYRLITLKNISLLVHEIASTPSFDQILLVSAEQGAPGKIYSDSSKPLSEDNWPQSLTAAGIHLKKELYFEHQDFQ